MKKINIILTIISFLFLFTSCEDPVKVDVKAGPERLVVDAFVNNMPTKQVIRITKSIPYFNSPGSEPPVTGARVVVLDTTSFHLFEFADSGQGNYIFHPNKITGDTFTVGHKYLLLVAQGIDTFVSFSEMKPTAIIDSLHVFEEDGTVGRFKKGKYVEMVAKDLVGTGNTYWIKSFRNDSFKNKIGDLNLAYDMTQSRNPSDGGLFIWPVRIGGINDFGRPLKTGEKFKIELFSITVETYYYFSQIISENSNGGLFATPPINIFTNIFNFNPKKTRSLGGFFCMSAVSKKEVLIK